MAISKINTSSLTDNSVTAGKIVAGAVDADIAAGSIDTAQLANDAVTADKLANAINTTIAAKATNTAVAAKAPIASPVFTGNVGIGVTPETDWHSSIDALQIGAGASIYGDTTATGNQISSNARATAGSALSGYKYIATDKASTYQQYDGQHNFRVAASGSADAAITWTTGMFITNTGQVAIGPATAVGNNYILNLKAKAAQSTVKLQSINGYDAIDFHNTAGQQCGFIRSNASSVAYNTSSDYRLKENVTPISGATAAVKLLKPCNFDWIAGGNVNGFIAHELADVVPEAVSGTKDAMMDEQYEVTAATDTEAAVMGTRSVPSMQGIDQSKIIPILTATIQELITRIEALESA